ncbi:MAG: tRNA uridine-5-carboxymethylaminomethyl(34) synthesis GTPase MnmE [Nitrospirae bacterium]|nr:tRNA uridine-5-carboxymethylaminomethyl(34) synthesis GTPase MnmE [Nitrospirota bacterium]
MEYIDDTIAAISTPVGQGGVGIVRVSGPDAIRIAGEMFRGRRAPFDISAAGTYTMRYGEAVDPSGGKVIDEVLVSVMRAPRSYTKEDVVEINCHGGMATVRRVLETVLGLGARLAAPGEFTKRAFLNGRISLPQAEAVMDLILARTDESRRIALDQLKGGLSLKLEGLRDSLIEICAFAEAYIDFPEDEIEVKTNGHMLGRISDVRLELEKLSRTFDEARFFREGLSVAIVGRPNVGKSSLLNAFLERDRAIVTSIPGTTRDVLEEGLNIDGLPLRIVDTAGIRKADEVIEKEGIKRSLYALDNADYVLAVFDGSENLTEDDMELIELIRDKKGVMVINKTDLPPGISYEAMSGSGKKQVRISTLTGEGLAELKSEIIRANLENWDEEREGVVITNLRQKLCLDNAASALARSEAALTGGQPLEIFSIELRDALDGIGGLTGAVTNDMILDKIFSDFCIGK